MTRGAFTLIEMMVTVAVIAVLLGIALPALRSARIAADSAACQVNLSSIAKLQAAYAASNNGQFPNALESGIAWVEWRYNNAWYGTGATLAQSDWWPGPLSAKGYYDSNEPTQGMACPVVRRNWLDNRLSDTDSDDSPERSYRYSPAMFTEAKLWNPDDQSADQARRERYGADRYRKSVRIDEVKFPSHKVVMSEKEDNHGRGALFGDPGLLDSEKAMAKANVSFVDGHVDRVEPYRARKSLIVNWEYIWLPNGLGAIPFNAAADGHRGRDY